MMAWCHKFAMVCKYGWFTCSMAAPTKSPTRFKCDVVQRHRIKLQVLRSSWLPFGNRKGAPQPKDTLIEVHFSGFQASAFGAR